MTGQQDNPFLKQAYKLDSQQATKELYRDWAESYDDTMASHDYRTPARCAEALLRHLPDRTAPIFDIGCGTGISGMALAGAGFATIDGSDISEEMVDKARNLAGVYRNLSVVSLENPFSFDNSYAALNKWFRFYYFYFWRGKLNFKCWTWVRRCYRSKWKLREH